MLKRGFPKIKEHILLYKKDKFSGFTEIDKYQNRVWDRENNIFLKNFTLEDRQALNSLEDKDFNNNDDALKAIKILGKAKKISLSQKIREVNLTDCEQIEQWKFDNAYRIIKTAGSSSLARLVKSFESIPDQDLSAAVSKAGVLFYYITDFNRETTQPRLQVIFADTGIDKNPCDFWQDIKTTGAIANEGGVLFANSKKPEKLIQRTLKVSTNKGDLVLDSFLGSGTTCAVAQKMGRKYIGIEMGEHAYTHCKVRLDKVIDGSDQGGISKAIGWKGGGAYKFYELAPSFIVQDEFGNPVIDGFYNDTKLIKAMCKLMNFTFQPSQTQYWKHGVGQGKNYLYVTTQLLTSGMISQIAAHLAAGESLMITPKKFEPGADKIDSRITIKKIPQSVLKACHFGKKEYLLPIRESAMEEVEIDE